MNTKKEEMHVTAEEYAKRYANKHCGGDIEQAKENKIVQIVLQEIKERERLVKED